MVFEKERPRYWQSKFSWSDCLGRGLTDAVTSAVDVAGGRSAYLGDTSSLKTTASLAKSWFISSYPLLGALASNFKIDECIRFGRSFAFETVMSHPSKLALLEKAKNAGFEITLVFISRRK